MKKARKLITFILTAVMVLSMSMNVMAGSITMDGGADGSHYAAYKLLDATDLGAGKFSYTVNATYRDILEDVTGIADDDEGIITHIKGLDADGVRSFANDVYQAIKAASITAEKTTETNIFTDVVPGYYLIAETVLGDWGEGQSEDTYSLVMLDTAGNGDITVETKEERPTLSKQIIGDDNSDGDDIATDKESNNLSIGSKVQFELSTIIPAQANQYDYYYCIFSDNLSSGLTFDDTSIIVMQNGTPLEESAYELYTKEQGNADGNTFQVALKDAKSLAGKEIKVTYWAELNNSAAIGDDSLNTNIAKLEYSNDPNTKYGEYNDPNTPGKPDPDPEDPLPNVPMGETPNQITNTYTTGIKLFKTDENDIKLTGAEFQITGDNMAVVLVSGDVFEENEGGTYYKLNNGNYTTTAPNGDNNSEYVSTTTKYIKTTINNRDMDKTSVDIKAFVDENGYLTFEGLGEGTYIITETTVPAGYNKASDMEVIIEWNPDAVDPNKMWTATVGGNSLTFNDAEGVFDLTIKNQSGSELPSTGGIGTTIFYIVGGALVLFAVVLLVTKKRMKDAQ